MGPTAVGGAGAPLDPPLALPLLLGIGRFATLLRAFSWHPPIAMLEVVPDTLSFTAAVTSARPPRLLLRTRNSSASTTRTPPYDFYDHCDLRCSNQNFL